MRVLDVTNTWIYETFVFMEMFVSTCVEANEKETLLGHEAISFVIRDVRLALTTSSRSRDEDITYSEFVAWVPDDVPE